MATLAPFCELDSGRKWVNWHSLVELYTETAERLGVLALFDEVSLRRPCDEMSTARLSRPSSANVGGGNTL